MTAALDPHQFGFIDIRHFNFVYNTSLVKWSRQSQNDVYMTVPEIDLFVKTFACENSGTLNIPEIAQIGTPKGYIMVVWLVQMALHMVEQEVKG